MCGIPESLILYGFCPSVTLLEESVRFMQYQNFFMRKYHWIVNASMMKLRVSPETAEPLR